MEWILLPDGILIIPTEWLWIKITEYDTCLTNRIRKGSSYELFCIYHLIYKKKKEKDEWELQELSL